ncbi:MAG TPA: leucyl aminopeptidase [Clostridia bacterium]|nr:leucyl aminopeptidase [Clostridia bacterium]
MKTILSHTPPSQLETEVLVVAVLDTGDKENSVPELQCSDANVRKSAEDLIGAKEVTGKLFETVMLHRPQGLKAKRILFVGGGKSKNFSSYELRKLAGTAVRFLKPKGIKSFAFVAPESWDGVADPTAQSTLAFERGGLTDAVRSITEGAFVGNFDPDYYKSDRKDQTLDELTVVAPANSDKKALEAALEEGRIIGESQNFTRDLVNEPGNRMTPTILADRAQKMCQEVGLKCEVYGPAKLHELKMGAFWSVSQGSEQEPRLIVMRYEPANAPAEPTLGLVGKGITFDSGGISIKPSDGMEKMKYDMAGGAAMIGTMRAIALLKPDVRVISVVCASENMPSGKAQKPGDIQIAMNGKSIEIINTDAEGRLVLADGLHYARQLGATHLVDAATLTGACVVALGHVNAGIFCNDESYFIQFANALKRSGEKMWRLPVDAEYGEMIKSHIADIVNSGGRWGGAVTAAMFLKEFVEDTPWIHLDIAGTAWVEDSKSWIAKGPSGFAVRSLVEFTRQFASNGGNPPGSGFTGGTQEKTRKGTKAAQDHADSGAGL